MLAMRTKPSLASTVAEEPDAVTISPSTATLAMCSNHDVGVLTRAPPATRAVSSSPLPEDTSALAPKSAAPHAASSSSTTIDTALDVTISAAIDCTPTVPTRCSTSGLDFNTDYIHVVAVSLLKTGTPKDVSAPMEPSLKSFADIKLDTLAPTRCSMICFDDYTSVLTPTFTPDATSSSPSTTALLDIVISNPTLPSADVLVRLDTQNFVVHQLFDEMHMCTEVDFEVWPWPSVGPTIVIAPTGQGDELVHVRLLCLSNDCKALKEASDEGTMVLWPPPMRWFERQPWPWPTQVDITGEGAELRPTPWSTFICYQGGVQPKQSWPPLVCEISDAGQVFEKGHHGE